MNDKTVVMRRLLFLLSALSGALVLFSCSLRPYAPELGLTVSPEQMRDVSELTHFAIAASEGVSDSLTSANVGNRSLECLNAVGQIFFPFTLSQLKAGASIPIVGGAHRFTILGFKDVTGTPTTVAQLFSGSSQLKTFVVAQKSVNTLVATSVAMQSTYVSGGSTDLMVRCLPASSALHGLYNVSSSVSYLKNTGSWASTNVGTGANPSLFVDNQGVAHASMGGASLTYLNNASGSFVSDGDIAGAVAGSSGIVRMSNGAVQVLATRLALASEATVFSRTGPAAWVEGGTVLTNGLTNFADLNLRIGPKDTMLATATKNTTPPVVQVNTKGASATWAAPLDLGAAGAQPCSWGTSKAGGAVDSLGKSHVLFRCQITSAPDSFILAYATNRTGSWVASTVGLSTNSLVSISLTMDGGDLLHAIYSTDLAAYYITAPSQTGAWSAATVVYLSSQIGGVAIGALNSTTAAALFEVVENGDRRLRPATFASGTWQTGPLLISGLSTFQLFPLIYYR